MKKRKNRKKQPNPAMDWLVYILFGFLAVSFLLSWISGSAASGSTYKDHVPDQLIAKIKTGSPFGAAAALAGGQTSLPLSGLKITGSEKLFTVPEKTAASGAAAGTSAEGPAAVHRIILAPGTDLEQARKILEAVPGVIYAEPNYLLDLDAVPNDPGYSQQWHQEKIGSPLAWNVATGSSSVVVAIVDSGVDTSHPDLAANIWTNDREIPGNSLDDDGNGFIDDRHGYNFCTYPSGTPNSDISDGCGHGTHLAGIAAAVGNNAVGVCGVVWQARIMPVKFVSSGGSGSTADAVQAVRYAADNGAQILNLSFGTTNDSASLHETVDYALGRGCIVFASTGNNNSSAPRYPAAYPGVLAVGASDPSDHRAGFSNYGNYLFITAPGVNIYSTSPGSGYRLGSGTSQAAPVMAGAAALIKSIRPELNRDQMADLFKNSADDLVDPNGTGESLPGRDDYTGWGRLNLDRALTVLGCHPDYSAPTIEIITLAKLSFRDSSAAITANVSSSAGIKKNGIKMTLDETEYLLPDEVYRPRQKQLVIPVGNQGYEKIGRTTHVLTLAVTDNNGRTGSASVTITEAETELALSSALVCPNPLVGDGTYFCYNLSIDAQIEIYVYDSAAYRVKKIVLAAGEPGARAGANKVFWDGTSDFNTQLARDAYFYLITASAGGQKVAARGKLAIAR